MWELAERETPHRDTAAYTQAIMDLGAAVCTRSKPRCADCPLVSACHACRHGEQQSLPTGKTKNPMPVRRVIFALLETNRGKYCWRSARLPASGRAMEFPGIPFAEAARSLDNHRASLVSEEMTALPKMRHSFSHFHLDIIPVRGRIRAKAGTIADDESYLWYTPGHGPEIGLAAPVKALMEKVSRTDPGP